MENELDPKTTSTEEEEAVSSVDEKEAVRSLDEKEAVRSLDDTTIRPLPEVSAIWEPLEPPLPTPEPGHSSRARTLVLVAAVAIVSFVAGGITARLSSQMPVLFAKAPEATESTASYGQRYQPTNPVDETDEQEPDRILSPNSLDTGYDTTDDSSDAKEEERYAPLEDEDEEKDRDKDKDKDKDKDRDEDGSTLHWFTDDEDDGSDYKDDDERRVTLDYNGYGHGFTLEDFLDEDTIERLNQLENEYNTRTYEDRRRYDSGTGYDSTDAERDSYGWRGWGGYDTYGYHS